ncbi:hypothetical protein CLV40_12956 [Actinokineospora auranticolor]|uniref:Uncharacterized protein n=1 Tax=Actinokineospora auranticolor TaxID=155976 RepID=A0A2S6GDP6_9PSEU|nr:hypothetical protein CLV40_12956 [Actinokineospora auranticolor]
MPRHTLEARMVSVAELVKRETAAGRALRLHWRESDVGVDGLVDPAHGGDWPTALLPRVTPELAPSTAAVEDSAKGLHSPPARRSWHTALPSSDPSNPMWVQDDLGVLERVLHGLQRLAQTGSR